MNDVRSLLRLVERAPMPDLWPDVASRTPRPLPPSPGPGRRVLAAAIALAVAAAGFVFVFEAVRPDDAPSGVGTPPPMVDPTVPPLVGEPTIAAEVPVPNGLTAYDLAVGAGAVWVGLDEGIVDDGGGGSIGRIDLTTNEIVAQIPVERAPYRDQIAATDDAVWVASGSVVERIDPATNEVVARVDIGDRSAAAVAADVTAVWALGITASSDDIGGVTGSLIRIDPTSNAIVADISLGTHPVGYLDELRIGAGSVWVLGVRLNESNNDEYGSDLIRVDPASNEVVARIPVHGFHMAIGTDEVWVRFPADGVLDSPTESWLWTRVDASTNEPSSPFAFDDVDPGDDDLRLVASGALWAVGYDEQGDVRVTSFDPATLDVVTRSDVIGSNLKDATVDPATRTVWIATGETIVRLDIVRRR